MPESVQLTVTGMKCGGCEANVTGKLQAVAGVQSVVATHKENKVSIDYDAEQTDLATLIQVITDAGFEVE